MARKSRKTYRAKLYGQESTPADQPKQNKIRTALYCRLSVADASTGKDSMNNQLARLRQYVSDHEELEIADEFLDDGFTGTTFNRPQFKKMMDGVKEGRYRCVIVKDLSRLGRNYLETSYLIEVVLPLFGSRLIAINDKIDTDRGNVDTILIGLKNLMNQQYAEDISRKVKARLHMMALRGETQGVAPYGYMRDPDRKGYLMIDEETAAVVKEIFDFKLRGMSPGRIAEILNKKGVLTPKDLLVKRWTGREPEKHSFWSKNTIFQILRSEVYLGHSYYDTYEERNFLGERARVKDRSEWKIVKDVNPPIISQEIFDRVQEKVHGSLKGGTQWKGVPPYGYQLNPDRTGTYLIDEEAATVVRRIFQMKISGIAINDIVRILNKEGIRPPQDHKRSKERSVRNKKKKWCNKTVTAILRSEAYLGHQYYDTSDENWRRKKRSEWKLIRNVNPPIITQEMYDKAQEERMQAKKHRGLKKTMAVYGYKTDPQKEGELLIDEEAAKIIRSMYALKVKGLQDADIADILNQKDVFTPRDYHTWKMEGREPEKRGEWRASAVYRILTNEIYLGHMYYETYERDPDGSRHRRKRSEWKVKKNVHPAIISQEIFDRAISVRGRWPKGGQSV